MDIARAKKLKAELEPRNKPAKASKIFIKRINYAKGYCFLWYNLEKRLDLAIEHLNPKQVAAFLIV